MARIFFIIASVCLTSTLAAVPVYPGFVFPEHRTALKPLKALEVPVNLNDYEYQVIPADEYAVAQYDTTVEPSLFDIIPNPITAVSSIVNTGCSIARTLTLKALSLGKWIVVNGGMMILGMALVVGFCAFTPYCTLIIEKPFFRELPSFNIPYLDNVEYFFNEAVNKYRDLQKSL